MTFRALFCSISTGCLTCMWALCVMVRHVGKSWLWAVQLCERVGTCSSQLKRLATTSSTERAFKELMLKWVTADNMLVNLALKVSYSIGSTDRWLARRGFESRSGGICRMTSITPAPLYEVYDFGRFCCFYCICTVTLFWYYCDATYAVAAAVVLFMCI